MPEPNQDNLPVLSQVELQRSFAAGCEHAGFVGEQMTVVVRMARRQEGVIITGLHNSEPTNAMTYWLVADGEIVEAPDLHTAAYFDMGTPLSVCCPKPVRPDQSVMEALEETIFKPIAVHQYHGSGPIHKERRVG